LVRSRETSHSGGGKTVTNFFLFNDAFESNYWLASTMFHEFTHAFSNKYFPIDGMEAERQAYSTEWRLGNQDKSIWNQIIKNQKIKK
jgi:hypothetical protein